MTSTSRGRPRNQGVSHDQRALGAASVATFAIVVLHAAAWAFYFTSARNA